ncbi:MAG: TRAP transporter substrate-binding protein [Alphaproteobacteria bacterium]
MKLRTRLLAPVCALPLLLILSTAEAQDTTIKFVTANPENSYHGAFALGFKKHVEELSDGRVAVELFLGGQMGSEQDNVTQVSTGIMNVASMAVNNVTPFSPIVGFATLPYMFNNLEEAWAVLDSPLRDDLNETMIEQGNFRAIAWMTGGFRVLTNSKKPVRTPADLQGLRIRVAKNDIMIATYKAWGIDPVPMAWTELFPALQQKVVDGQDNPYMVLPAVKFYEVQKYVTNIHWILWVGPVIANEGWYQSLDPEIREIVDEAALRAEQEERDWAITHEALSVLAAVEHGMEITVPADDEKEWMEKAKSVWPQFYDDIGGKDFVDRVVAFLEEYRAAN